MEAKALHHRAAPEGADPDEPRPGVWARLLALLIPVIPLVLGAGSLYFGGRDLLRALASPEWPTVQGTIHTSEVVYERDSDDSGGTYHAEIAFEYRVGGKRYMATGPRSLRSGSSDPNDARQLANRYPRGSGVTVWYLPSNPSVGTLEPGFTLDRLIFPLAGIGLLWIGLRIVSGARSGRRPSDPGADGGS